MKTIYKRFIPAAVALTVLAACTNEGNEPDVNGATNAPAFTATIGSARARALDQKWEAADEIGISGCGRSNVRYVTTAGDGTFTVKNVGEQIYFQDDKTAVFTAYYPWNALEGGAAAITADTKAQAQQKTFDFLWAQASGQKNSPDVNFTFAHSMAKLVITVRPGSDISFDELKAFSLSLAGFSHAGSFTVADGTTTAAAATADAWVFSNFATYDETAKTATFSFILFPQSFSKPLDFGAALVLEGDKSLTLSAPVDFTSANSEKDGAAARNEWVAGRQYNLSLTLNKTDLSLNKCEIKPWSVVTADEITVD